MHFEKSNESFKKILDNLNKKVLMFLEQDIKDDVNGVLKSFGEDMPSLKDWFADEKLENEIKMEIGTNHWKMKYHIKKNMINL